MLDENPFSVKRGNRPSALTLDYGEILFRLSLTFRGHYIQPAMALVLEASNGGSSSGLLTSLVAASKCTVHRV